MSVQKEELKALIAAKRDIIANKTKDSAINTDDFRQLLSLLVNFAQSAPISAFGFHIDEVGLKTLQFQAIKNNLDKEVLEGLKLHNFFVVDQTFSILEKTQYNPPSSTDAREIYKDISENNHCVILLVNNIYSVFHNGIETTNTTFVAEADLKKWEAKRDITKLPEILAEYKQHIQSQDVYFKFFAEKSVLKNLYGNDYLKHRNLLRNKPEGVLRDDLKNFLRDNINRTFNFSRESLLDSDKRLDINTEDELGNYYFLEIKWIGKSLNDDASGEGKEYYATTRPQEGLKQTLEYIDEMKSMNKVVRIGYLVVFDARITKAPLTYDWSKIKKALHEHKKCYSCVDDLHIDNTKPR